MSSSSDSSKSIPEPLVSDEVLLDEKTPLAIGKAHLKTLSSMGHVLSRFLEARRVLLKRIEKHPEDEAMLATWFQRPEQAMSPVKVLEGDGCFASAFLLSGKGLLLSSPFVHVESLVPVLRVLGVSGVPLETPADANASLWPTVLRLGKLRAFWEQEMRKNLYEALCSVLPDAWVLDATPIPAGAVIPRLEIADWSDFPESDFGDQQFAVAEAWQKPISFEQANDLSLGTAVEEFPAKVSVLTSRPTALGEEEILLAVYEKKGGRTELLKALQLKKQASGATALVPVVAG